MTEESDPKFTAAPEILELDHVFEGLAHPRRRYLLYTLQTGPNWILKDIAVKIAAWESEAADADPPDDHIEAVYISLYHNHVPKLASEDMIEFDEVTEQISPGPNAEQVLSILDTAGGSTDSQLESHAEKTDNEGRT